MPTYLISLEPRAKRNYSELSEKINALSQTHFIQPLKSLWIAYSDLDSTEIRDQLLTYIYAKDSLLVIKIDAEDWASWNINDKSAHWLNSLLKL